MTRKTTCPFLHFVLPAIYHSSSCYVNVRARISRANFKVDFQIRTRVNQRTKKKTDQKSTFLVVTAAFEKISPKLCGRMKIFKFLLLLAQCTRLANGDLIAKSSITICENTGGGDDPMSVVYEKACEKKLIVTMSVRSGQVRRALFLFSLHCL